MEIAEKYKNAEKKQEILEHAEKTLTDYSRNRGQVDRLWFKSILFYRGEQWVRFDTNTLRFRRINHRRTVPRPTTNKFKPTLNAIISAMTRFEPKLTFVPQTDRLDDIQSASTATKVIRVIEHEVNWMKRKAELLPWLVICGNVHIVTGFNTNSGPRMLKMKTECPRCSFKQLAEVKGPNPLCPECQKDGRSVELEPILDKNGEPITVTEPMGQLDVDVANPFQMFFDFRVSDLERQHTIIRIHPKDITWVKATWPELADKIEPTQRRELSTHLTETLASLTGSAGTPNPDTTVDIVEVWHKPSEQFPSGYYARYIGNGEVVLDLIEYPWLDNRQEAFYPITHFVFDRLPGSALGTTPAFDLIEKQFTRNRIEAIGEAILLRMSNPVWLRPVPGTMSELTGQVGQVVDVDLGQTGGVFPQRLPGVDLPVSIVAWLDREDRDFAEIAAQYEVARGERPLSVRTASAVRELRELNSDRNAGFLVNYAIGVAEWQQQAFEIFRIVSPPDRYFRILGEQASWSVSKVQASDLRGGVDIVPQINSVLPKGHAEQAQLLEFFLQVGLMSPGDPVQVLKVYQQFGMESFLPGIHEDDAYIRREQDRWRQTGQISVSTFDNHALHLARHLAYWKSEEFETFLQGNEGELPAEVQNFLNHIGEHQAALNAQFTAQGGAPVEDTGGTVAQ